MNPEDDFLEEQDADEDDVEAIDWDEWPQKRAEMLDAVSKIKTQIDQIARPELDGLLRAQRKFLRDMENVIAAGDEEYRRRYPGARFEPN